MAYSDSETLLSSGGVEETQHGARGMKRKYNRTGQYSKNMMQNREMIATLQKDMAHDKKVPCGFFGHLISRVEKEPYEFEELEMIMNQASAVISACQLKLRLMGPYSGPSPAPFSSSSAPTTLHLPDSVHPPDPIHSVLMPPPSPPHSSTSKTITFTPRHL